MPLGIAADTRDNTWVANSGLISVPCPDVAEPDSLRGSVTLIGTGQATNFTGGGITIPWGIAVDGNDTVWVANFAGKRLCAVLWRRPVEVSRRIHCRRGDLAGGERLRVRRSHA